MTGRASPPCTRWSSRPRPPASWSSTSLPATRNTSAGWRARSSCCIRSTCVDRACGQRPNASAPEWPSAGPWGFPSARRWRPCHPRHPHRRPDAMDTVNVAASVRKVLYHHRTQGKAVEGVHIRGITDALRREGVDVDVVSLPGADPYASPGAMSPTRQARPWMKLVTGLPEPLFELAELAYNLVAGWRVLGWLRRNPDVDFIYERYSLFMYATIWLARRRGVPIILEVNDSAIVERVRPLSLRRLAMAIERRAFRDADGLVFVSSVFRDRARAVHPDMAPAIVTPNAADIAKFSFTAEQRAQARGRLGLDGSVVCGYLGAFVPWHAIDAFVHRIAGRLASAPGLKLLLVGDGATYPALRAF